MHIPDMVQGGGWSRSRGALLGAARRWGVLLALSLLSPLGCSRGEPDNLAIRPPEDYVLGGQTGSLIPGCGVAPLSAEGRAVPAGDALAIVYAGDCPEQAAALAGVMLDAADANTVPVEVVPLDEEGAFLVRTAQSLPPGEYQLSFGSDEGRELRVEAEASAVPLVLGPLTLREGEACPDVIELELTLDGAALAYAPLSRFTLRVDGGDEQLWVDYGALRIENGPSGARGVLELPRCGERGCLEPGDHRLELGAVIAGEMLQPASVAIDFFLDCPTPVGASDASSEAGCAVSVGWRSHHAGIDAASLAALAWLALCRSRRRFTPSRGA